MAKGQQQLFTDISVWMTDFTNMLARAKELDKRYGDTASSDVNAAPATGAILGTPLTQLQCQQCDSVLQDFIALQENGAVSNGFRRSIAYGIWTAYKL